VVAIPDLTEDDVLAEHLADIGVRVVRGSADDVLARYVQAAAESDAEVIVRITCDCPLIDPEVIDQVIEAFRGGGVDYCSNVLERTYPIGMDTEVFSREALERAHREAVRPDEREHVTPYIWRSPNRFRLSDVEAPEHLRQPALRLTVDEIADLEFVRIVACEADMTSGLAALLEVADRDDVERVNTQVVHRHLPKPK
jgi:spore coat polysaccharide biosynthesis protein SpsF (cytidylyltransferase family)